MKRTIAAAMALLLAVALIACSGNSELVKAAEDKLAEMESQLAAYKASVEEVKAAIKETGADVDAEMDAGVQMMEEGVGTFSEIVKVSLEELSEDEISALIDEMDRTITTIANGKAGLEETLSQLRGEDE